MAELWPDAKCCAHVPGSPFVKACQADATHLSPVAEYPLCDDHRDMKPCLKCGGKRCAPGACGHDTANVLPWPRLCYVCEQAVDPEDEEHWIDEDVEETGPQSSPDHRKVTTRCAGEVTMVQTFRRPDQPGPISEVECVRTKRQ